MARCEDMRLLLGPFEDGELEAHEMQEVARHVVDCADCDGELADYRKFAVSLRSFATTPDLTGFRTAVIARINDLPVPFATRVRRYLTSFADGIGATFATGFAAAAVAVVTAVILTPYLRQGDLLAGLRRPPQVASSSQLAVATPPMQVAKNIAPMPVAPVVADAGGRSDNPLGGEVSPAMESSDDSGAIIDKLEAESPSVAVWNAPQSDTTVIWVPDQLH